MPEIQIIEPLVFEIELAILPPGIPVLTTPPGIGLSFPISLNFTCPMSTYCGTDTPCGWGITLPLALTLPIPKFSFPPQFNLPTFGFRFEFPPSIFVNCPAMPDQDWHNNLANKDEKQSGRQSKELPSNDGKESIQIDKDIVKEYYWYL